MENKPSTELVPPKNDLKVGLVIFSILDEILKYRDSQGMPEKWNRYYQLRRNNHWKNKAAATVSLVSANLLGSHHVKTVNTLTDNNPTFDATIVGKIDDEEQLRTVIRLCEHWWNDQEQQHVLEESVSEGEINGTTVEKVSFNLDLEYPYGEVETETLSLFNFGWYPVKAKKLQKCEATLHFWPMSLREARRRWPDCADKLVADDEYIKAINDQRNELTGANKGEQGFITKISNVIKNLIASKGINSESNQETVVVEAWVKDYSKDKDGNNLYTGNIRRIQCGCCGNVVFSDENNPSINPLLAKKAANTYLYDKFPFSVTQSVTDPTCMTGMPDFEQLEGMNIEINKTISQMTLVKDKASTPKFINPKDSGVHNDDLTNYPGILNPTDSFKAQALKYVDPMKIDPHMMTVLEIYKDFFFMVAGTFDMESAQTPGQNVIAYKAIAAVLENAARMLKGKTRNYSKMIRERGRMYLSHVQNWYTEERWISFSDETGSNQAMPIKGEELILPIKLTVVNGSTMPRSQIQRREEALAVADKGHIDSEELLKALDWPDYMNVVKRMQAGPLGSFFDKLMGVGVPEELIQYFQELSQMKDTKEVDRAVKSGDVSIFPEVIQSMMGDQPEPQGDPGMEAEAQLKGAQAQKTIAEMELIREKVLTERVMQLVKTKGVDFDEEKLRILRAQVVSEMEAKGRELDNKTVETEAKAKALTTSDKSKVPGPYREKGLKSNNQE
ncbi:MAG: hypothetical protein FP816_19665 [Desulfobacteraceae bacterium]|nr:hypothetical protein [Desulfobacteraceae bacterium]